MKRVTLVDRLRYTFDNTMSKGPAALIGWLAVLSAAIVLVVAGVLSATGIAPEGSERLGLAEAAWMSLMRTLDAGTMGGDAGWPFRIAMLLVTFGGIFVISTLIGVLTSGIEGKLQDLRKGRSNVVETDHTVILGWSEQIYSVVSELMLANANQRRPCIVVMGSMDKVEMEDRLRDRVGPTGRTRLVCRTGNPIDVNNLDIAGINTARSIVVLSPEDDDPDSSVIKTILAITNRPGRRPDPYHIVAEIRDPDNLDVARMVGRDEVELIPVSELISRIIAQTCRQSGLSVVYTELLDFGGDEIYFYEEPALVGRPFGDALMAYEDSTVIGLQSRGGQPLLNPPMDTPIRTGDRLIVIADDDDKIRLSDNADHGLQLDAIRLNQPAPPTPERSLILGWNWRVPSILRELDHYVAPRSETTVVADFADGEAEIAARCPVFKNQTVSYHLGDTADRRVLEGLGVEKYNHLIVLSADGRDPQQADARTLITLLHLRDMAGRSGQNFSIVSEMLDLRNRALAKVTKADDFIVSDKLISLMLSQVSENKALNAVFADLFDPDGSEVYLKLASNYVALGQPINFYTVVEAARRRDEIAIGYRVRAQSDDPSKAYGVVVNPDKSATIAFSEGDRLVVISEG